MSHKRLLLKPDQRTKQNLQSFRIVAKLIQNCFIKCSCIAMDHEIYYSNNVDSKLIFVSTMPPTVSVRVSVCDTNTQCIVATLTRGCVCSGMWNVFVIQLSQTRAKRPSLVAFSYLFTIYCFLLYSINVW